MLTDTYVIAKLIMQYTNKHKIASHANIGC